MRSVGPPLAAALLILTVQAWGAAAQAPEAMPQLPVLGPTHSWPNVIIGSLQTLGSMFLLWLGSAAYRMQGQVHKLETERDLWRERALDHGWVPHDHQRGQSDEPPVDAP